MSTKRLAIVTGASRGFGRAIAHTIASLPYFLRACENDTNNKTVTHLVLIARSENALRLVQHEIDNGMKTRNNEIITSIHVADLTDENDLKRTASIVFDSPVARSCTTALLFNNSGIMGSVIPLADQLACPYSPSSDGDVHKKFEGKSGECEFSSWFSSSSFEMLSSQYLNDFQKTFKLNLVAPAYLSSVFVNAAKMYNWDPATCAIVYTSSLAALEPFCGWSAYCASKAAMDMLNRVLSEEWSSTGVAVKILSYAPGPMYTDMVKGLVKSMRDGSQAKSLMMSQIDSGNMVDAFDSARKLFAILAVNAYRSGEHIDYYDTLSVDDIFV